ncbi:hypothetical protein PV04_03552 [Phialophora macrospora]|uniref:Uncharacterized protein n=1 Tax=Phialophora macrospora TaxID=1851006 RepID=A0A0D2D1P0_9EURO|nr:hypothetical protein PV04_03552 [Phialophora macrospora]
MAETIGVVAAAFEFAKIVLEVKNACSSIKHAPQNLKQLLEELEALEEILETYKEQEATLSAYAPPDVVRKCRLRSERAVQSLKPICDELLKCIKQSRIRGSVKAVLKEDALDKARQVVERAKVDFILAQMAALNALSVLNVQKHSETHTLIVASSASVSAIVQDIRQQSISSPSTALVSPSGNAVAQDVSEPVRSNSCEQSRRRQWVNVRTRRLLRLQSRYLGRALEIVQQQACGAWTYGFRTYNFRPRDAPVFRYAQYGDIVALQQLFQTGQASILDRDPDGETLLHLACGYADATTIRFLMQQGLDPNDKDNRLAWSCIRFCWSQAQSEKALEVIHALREGPELNDLVASPQSLLKFSTRPFNAYLLPGLIQMISPPWSTWSLSTRLEAAYDSCKAYLGSDAFWLYLAKPQLDSSCLVGEISQEDAPPLYISLVEKLAKVLGDHWRYPVECPDFGGWRAIFRTAVGLDGLRVAFEHDSSSPMLTYLGLIPLEMLCPSNLSWADLSNERLTHKLRHWATEILKAGQDLQEYGKWEREHLIAKGREFRSPCQIQNTSCLTLRIVGFTYGAVPDDWQIWVSLSSDERAGEFWNLLAERESPLYMPGAWPANEDRCWNCDREDTQNPSVLGWEYPCSRRRRRRMVRYFDLTKESVDEICGRVRYDVEYYSKNGRKQKAWREQFFKEAGTTPPPRLPY